MPFVSTSTALLGLLLVVITGAIMPLFGRKKLNFAGKHCYVGGGSEGTGLALACILASRGAHLSILSRSEAKLKKALEEIETHRVSPSQKFAYYPCDLTDLEKSASTFKAACAVFDGKAPEYIFAVAGSASPTFFHTMSAEQHWRAMELNFKTVLGTIHEGLSAMVVGKQGGTIVLTGSVLSMMSFVGYSSYAPSKYAIRGLADSLRMEMLPHGINIHLFLPATIYSPGYVEEQKAKPQVTKDIEGAEEGVTPEVCAQELIAGLERNDYYITYEPVGHMLRNSVGPVPGNSVLLDLFWGIAGSIGFPVWRRIADSGTRKKLT